MKTITTYETKDGRTFDNEHSAKQHQQYLDDPLTLFIVCSIEYPHSFEVVAATRSYDKAISIVDKLRKQNNKDMYNDIQFYIKATTLV